MLIAIVTLASWSPLRTGLAKWVADQFSDRVDHVSRRRFHSRADLLCLREWLRSFFLLTRQEWIGSPPPATLEERIDQRHALLVDDVFGSQAHECLH